MYQATREISLFRWLLQCLLLLLPAPPMPVSFRKASQSTYHKGKAWRSHKRRSSRMCLDTSRERLCQLCQWSCWLWLWGPITVLCFVNKNSTLPHLHCICVSESSCQVLWLPTEPLDDTVKPSTSQPWVLSMRRSFTSLGSESGGLHPLPLPIHHFHTLHLCKECVHLAVHQWLCPRATNLWSSMQWKWSWWLEHQLNQPSQPRSWWRTTLSRMVNPLITSLIYILTSYYFAGQELILLCGNESKVIPCASAAGLAFWYRRSEA